MKFGRQWYDGVVKDHDVSTENELIWGVAFDDGDECALNFRELLAVMLPTPPAALSSSSNPFPTDFPFAASSRPIISLSSRSPPSSQLSLCLPRAVVLR